MDPILIVQGRRLGRPELEQLRHWVSGHPGWSRRRLSVALASRWDWRNPAGQLKDMAARTLLLKLHQRGLLELPPRRQAPTNRMRCAAAELALAEEPTIRCPLGELGPLQIKEVSGVAAQRAWIKAVLARHHYLGFSGAVGENLQYVISDGQGRRLVLLFLNILTYFSWPYPLCLGILSLHRRVQNICLEKVHSL